MTSIRPDLRSLKCPRELADLPAWVTWRFEHEAGEEKARKVPYYADGLKRTGRQGRPEDRAHLTTFAAAKAAAAKRGMDGVGFCPLEDWGICALDFDACVTHGVVMPEVERLCAGTYAEISPSGTGVRAFFKGNLGNRKSHQRKGWPFGVETFSSRGFVTVTGQLLEITELCETQDTVADLTPEVRALFEERFGDRPIELSTENVSTRPPIGMSERQLHECLEVLDAGMDYDDWIRVGMALHHETNGHGFDFWNEWSAGWAHYPGDDALKSHWNSFGRAGGRVVTANWLVNQANEQGAHIDVAGIYAADFEVIANEAEPTDDGLPTLPDQGDGKKASRFKPIAWHEYMQRPAPEWIIDGVLPRADLAVLFGDSGSGKTFVMVDLAMSIARGVAWRGLATKKLRVVYVVAEGAAFFSLRLKAYALKNEMTASGADVHFVVIPAAPNMMEKNDALELAREIKAAGGADIVVMDTWAQVTPGANENSGEDMGRALAHCRGVGRALLGAMVILVHHSGKVASKGARGWSGLRGGADTQLEVKRALGGRVLATDKQKDGDDAGTWAFDLERIPVGMRENGDPIYSCVVVPLEALPVQQAAVAKKRLGKWESIVVDALTALLEASGETSADIDAVVDAAVDLVPEDQRNRHTRFALRRAMEGLGSDDTTSFRVEDGRLYAD